ncbi:3-hydroxyacyl-CoA dehydrogenase NAD-binding domain-containing protein [uncultured Bacteroides sp.]|uniref:3-hydroxyacyl-CoA dehydrogenase family protein n=1 Tax=uncultured Bacteroides sp. TaxID=162156 RepID=UPI002AABE691|nr:3-hydroxyacyl-CoA dehydrogenase NAD-binding domain-containing protein [uncultured Bacteroides sp.]
MVYTKPTNYKERPIVIIGAGTLGMRIALMMATRDGEVRIYDPSSEQRNKANDFIQQQLPGLLTKFPGRSKGKVVLFDNLSKAVENAWIIFEAIPEKLELKKDLFGNLDRLAPIDAILASNSSSFPTSLFIDQVSESGKTRVVNAHFYMPPIQNAIEIMSCGFSDQAVIETLMDILPAYGGLVPFKVQKESVGFIFNRVWAAIKRECLDVVAAGISTPEDVDRIFMVNTGIPIGPFREMDQIGLDVILEIEEYYATLNPSLPTGPRELLRKYISQGKLGVKSRCGFYSYTS